MIQNKLDIYKILDFYEDLDFLICLGLSISQCCKLARSARSGWQRLVYALEAVVLGPSKERLRVRHVMRRAGRAGRRDE